MLLSSFIELESKQFRRKKLKYTRDQNRQLKERQVSDRSLPKDSPKTLIGMRNEKVKDDEKPGLMLLMKSEAQKKEEHTRTAQEYTELKHEETSLASIPNLPKATPPVFVTEMVKSEIKLPAIREEKTQEEIILHKDSIPQTNQNISAKELNNVHDNMSRSKDSSLNRDQRVTGVTKTIRSSTGKKQYAEHSGSLPQIKQAQNAKPDTFIEISDNDRGPVPKLPVLGGSQTSLNQGQDSQRTNDDSSSTVSSNWQTAITFVNKRVQERLTNVRMFNNFKSG